MKIVFVVSCINSKSNGLGGHYYSLIETTNRLSEKHDIVIISVGDKQAKALENIQHKKWCVIHQEVAIFKTQRELNRIVLDEKPDVLHAFDALAFLWVRRTGLKFKIPFCLTKCGGSNPIFFPYADNLILYSKENLDFFKNSKKFARTKLSLIPNRLNKFSTDEKRLSLLANQLGSYDQSFKFLRISRIGPYYLHTAVQLINLVKKLSEEGINCSAIFIGTVENEECFNQLKQQAPGNVIFFTDDEFTKNAKALIDCADAVIGTGRSFMEAAAKGKILLSPIENSSIPLLINDTNFDQAFHYNFSERTKLLNYIESENYNEIKRTISDVNKTAQLKRFSSSVFDDYFDVKKVTEKHETFYLNLKAPKRKFVNYILHLLFVIRKYYR
ncbi:glycosyltransferase family 4 protein [Fluviicola chungangensis]|uniref:Glycosyltransferase family 4 protein n=1 Tax=Fluviicola chungangensis TaxID=2597671 RepID=A0A556N0S6_9FLAO|nr:glycosyltransferase family 4 protein [Fluviicola chungangensis]TSJ45801.1 glycosyltransferase family 4 protein [Fluviicola chungangensis]